MTKVLMNPKEVAVFLHKSVDWVYRHWRDLGGFHIGHNLCFEQTDLERYVDACKAVPVRPGSCS